MGYNFPLFGYKSVNINWILLSGIMVASIAAILYALGKYTAYRERMERDAVRLLLNAPKRTHAALGSIAQPWMPSTWRLSTCINPEEDSSAPLLPSKSKQSLPSPLFTPKIRRPRTGKDELAFAKQVLAAANLPLSTTDEEEEAHRHTAVHPIDNPVSSAAAGARGALYNPTVPITHPHAQYALWQRYMAHVSDSAVNEFEYWMTRRA